MRWTARSWGWALGFCMAATGPSARGELPRGATRPFPQSVSGDPAPRVATAAADLTPAEEAALARDLEILEEIDLLRDLEIAEMLPILSPRGGRKP